MFNIKGSNKTRTDFVTQHWDRDEPDGPALNRSTSLCRSGPSVRPPRGSGTQKCPACPDTSPVRCTYTQRQPDRDRKMR